VILHREGGGRIADSDAMQGVQHLKRTIKRAADQVREAVQNDQSGGGVNIARRTNIVSAANIGRPGSVQQVEATQVAPIEQHGAGSSANVNNE